jgi:hypothetical protein
MPYEYVLVVVTVVLVVRHLRSDYASGRSKRLVGVSAAVCLLAPRVWPAFLPSLAPVALASLVLQFLVCFYIVFYQAAWRPDAGRAKANRTPRWAIAPEEASVEGLKTAQHDPTECRLRRPEGVLGHRR